jgi:hypothetical protein
MAVEGHGESAVHGCPHVADFDERAILPERAQEVMPGEVVP